VSYSSDGTAVVSGSLDGTARLWSATTAAVDAVFDRHAGAFAKVEFSPDGRFLSRAVAAAKEITVWDARSLKTVAVIPHEASGFSPDSRLLAATSPPNALTFWEIAQGPPQRRATMNLSAPPADRPVFSPDGRQLALAVGGEAAGVGIWDVATGQRVTQLPDAPGKPAIGAYAFSPDGRLFATGYDQGAARIWDARGWSPLRSLAGHAQKVQAIAFAPGGRVLATGSVDTTVRLWPVESGAAPIVLRGDAGAVFALAFAPDGQTLAVGTVDGVVKFWNIRTRREVATLKAHDSIVSGAAFSPDGRTLATISVDQTMKLWKAPELSETDR
jgi:WD40 repeat protein